MSAISGTARAAGLAGRLRGTLARLRADRRGAVAIVVALAMPVLVGAVAYAVDVAYWRYRLTDLQMTADATAIALGRNLLNNLSSGLALAADASYEVRRNCPVGCTVSVTYPNDGDPTQVLVRVTQASVQRFFSGIYSYCVIFELQLWMAAGNRGSVGGIGRGWR